MNIKTNLIRSGFNLLSDEWDKEEKKPFDGMMARDPKDCPHYFDEKGMCVTCLKTREQLRSEW